MIRGKNIIREITRRPAEETPRERLIRAGSIGGGGGAGLLTARITSHEGTEAPYIYTANKVTRSGAGYADVSPTVTVTLRNLAEHGPTGVGSGPLDEDDIVAYWADGDGYACLRPACRGQYL